MRKLVVLVLVLALAACAPLVQQAGRPGVEFQGPMLERDAFVSFDGKRLGLQRWEPQGEPWAVIVGLHGMNDYSNTFHLAAPFWARQGVATFAYDQRGFGRSEPRGVWGGRTLMAEDLRTLCALVRQRHPHAILAVAGVSMGGSVAIDAFASDRPPDADRLVLLSPGVWGWSTQPLTYEVALWAVAHSLRGMVLSPPEFVLEDHPATDNIEELRRMSRDPLMLFKTRPDAIYGLVGLMQRAWKEAGDVKVPAIYLYGARDKVIPPKPAFQAAARLPSGGRTAYYADGWHLLLVDLQGPKVWGDVLSFIKDPAAPLPSGAPPIPPPGSQKGAKVGS
jgi:alpha-beta hydrolase superfamily lysophospholipase